MSLANEWQRFMCWLQQGGDLPAAVQALCALVTVALTAALVWITHKYVQVTRELASSAQRQLMMIVQPSLDLDASVESVANTAAVPWFEARASVANQGVYPVSIKRAVISWPREDSGEPEERELIGLRNRVVPPGERVAERHRLSEPGGRLLTIEHLDSFSDFLTLTVSCCDLAGFCRCKFSYQQATGLTYTRTEAE